MGPHNKDYCILSPILGPLTLGNYQIPNTNTQRMARPSSAVGIRRTVRSKDFGRDPQKRDPCSLYNDSIRVMYGNGMKGLY